MSLSPALPVAALRRLLLLARLLRVDAAPSEQRRLAAVVRRLSRALELSALPVGTVGHDAAWAQLEQAAKLLLSLGHSLSRDIAGPFAAGSGDVTLDE